MTDFYLIGPFIEKYDGENSPTLRHILQVVLHKTHVLKKTIHESIKSTLDDLVSYYQKRGIQTAKVYNLTIKVEKIYNEWRDILRNKASSTSFQIERREKFKSHLDFVFAIEKIESKSKSVKTQTDQPAFENIIKVGTKRVSTSTDRSEKQVLLDEIEGMLRCD